MGTSLRILSFNMQAGTTTRHYGDYVTKSWQQLLPAKSRHAGLGSVADLCRPFDIVGLQEADAGSLRSGYVNQTRALAEQANFPFWSDQTNRKVSRFAYSSNGLLTRIEPSAVVDHKLPGRIPGRGALFARFAEHRLTVAVVHLALSRRARAEQLAFLSEVLQEAGTCVVMGDWNVGLHSPEMQRFSERCELHCGSNRLPTFPSWRPRRDLDHVLATRDIEFSDIEVSPTQVSDHCPVAVTINLPDHQPESEEPVLAGR